MRKEETEVYSRMRSSPYRSYFDEEIYDSAEIVSLKIIAGNDRIGDIEQLLAAVLPDTLRCCKRPQAGSENISALYIYSSDATVEKAGKLLMQMLSADEPGLIPEEIRSLTGYRSELDAIRLLHRIEHLYEPVSFFKKQPRKQENQRN